VNVFRDCWADPAIAKPTDKERNEYLHVLCLFSIMAGMRSGRLAAWIKVVHFNTAPMIAPQTMLTRKWKAIKG
jgi:hypothetical protein